MRYIIDNNLGKVIFHFIYFFQSSYSFLWPISLPEKIIFLGSLSILHLFLSSYFGFHYSYIK